MVRDNTSTTSSEDETRRAIDLLSRRRMLLGSAVALGGLAGCGGDGDSDDPTTTSEGGMTTTDGNGGGMTTTESPTTTAGEPISEELVFGIVRFPDELQYNNYNSQNSPDHDVDDTLHTSLAVADRQGEWQFVLGESWDIPDLGQEGDEISVTIRDDLTYHDGNPITAQSFVDSIMVGQEAGGAYTSITDMTAEDETTFTATVAEPATGAILTREVALITPRGGNAHYGPYVEQYNDATSQDERDSVTSELVADTWSEPIGSGPMMFNQATSNFLRLERFEDYPYPSNIPYYKWLYVRDSIQQAVQTGTLDVTQDRTAWMLNPRNLPSQQYEPDVRQHPIAPGGWALGFNMEDPHFGNRRVRQAIAWVVNRWSVNQDLVPANASDDTRETYGNSVSQEIMTKMNREQNERWLGDVMDDYHTYGYARDEQTQADNEARAQSILEDEGFSRENGNWFTPEGDRWTASIRTGPVFEPWGRSSQGLLSRFGLDISVNVLEPGNYWSQMFNADAEFTLTMMNWGSGSRGHPFFTYEPEVGYMTDITRLAATHGEGIGASNRNITVQVPYPVGNPEGDLQEVNVSDLTAQLKQADGDTETRELTRELAWIQNQFVPTIALYQIVSFKFITHDHWNWPEQGTPFDYGLDGFESSVAHVLGEVSAKTE